MGGRSIQVAFEEVVFVEPEVVSEFMEEGAAYFAAVGGGTGAGIVVNVFEEEENLGREWIGGLLFTKAGADEEAEGIVGKSFGDIVGVGEGLKGDGKVLDRLGNGSRQGGSHGGDLSFGIVEQGQPFLALAKTGRGLCHFG